MAKIVTILTSFLAVPLSLEYLGQEAFGLWATITSFVGMLAFADMGVGSGVMNAIAAGYGQNNWAAVRSALVNGFLVLVITATLGLMVFLLAYPLLSWEKILGLSDGPLAEAAGISMLVLAVLFAISIPTAVIQRLQFGIQQGYLNGLTQAAGGVLSLGMIFLAIRWNLGLEGMVGVYLLAPLIAAWISAAYMLNTQKQLMPGLNDIDSRQMASLLKAGMQFFMIHLAWAIGFATDNLIIAHMVGLDAVASYTVHQKLFSPLPLLAGFAMTPLWAAYAEAIARGDVRWVRRIFSIGTIAFFLSSTIAAICLYLLAEPLLQFWLHGKISVDKDLSLVYAVWIVVDITGKGVAMFLNGVGEIKSQMLIVAIFVPLVLVLKVYFAHRFGAVGVPAALVVAYTATHLPGYFMIVKRWFRENPGQPLVRP